MLKFRNVNIASLILIVVFVLLKTAFNISYIFLIALLIFWIFITIFGSFHIRLNYFLNSKHSNKNIKSFKIALTFDDGPNKEFTPKVLDLLLKYNAKATFFCIGKNLESNITIAKKIIENGNEIGNHSYIHANNYGFLSSKELVKDITKTQNLLFKVTNKKNKIFRPPFGVTNPNITKAVKQLNLISIGWSIRSYDTIAKKPEKVFLKIQSKIKKGAILLMHDTNNLSIAVLEQLLQFLEKNKIETITVSQLLNLDANA